VVEVHDDADIERAISTLSREPDSGLTHSVALNPFCQGLLIEGEADSNAAAR
jgi:hypothetical protein